MGGGAGAGRVRTANVGAVRHLVCSTAPLPQAPGPRASHGTRGARAGLHPGSRAGGPRKGRWTPKVSPLTSPPPRGLAATPPHQQPSRHQGLGSVRSRGPPPPAKGPPDTYGPATPPRRGRARAPPPAPRQRRAPPPPPRPGARQEAREAGGRGPGAAPVWRVGRPGEGRSGPAPPPHKGPGAPAAILKTFLLTRQLASPPPPPRHTPPHPGDGGDRPAEPRRARLLPCPPAPPPGSTGNTPAAARCPATTPSRTEPSPPEPRGDPAAGRHRRSARRPPLRSPPRRRPPEAPQLNADPRGSSNLTRPPGPPAPRPPGLGPPGRASSLPPAAGRVRGAA